MKAPPLREIARAMEIARAGANRHKSSKCEESGATYFSDRIAPSVVLCGRGPVGRKMIARWFLG